MNILRFSKCPRAKSVGLALSLMASAAQAQYTVDWFTIGGGGSTSTGGVYSASGTIGQPDAGTMSGGSFTVVGGYWSVVAAIQTPGAPLLSITRTNGSIIVSWPLPATDFILEQTFTLTGSPVPWTAVLSPHVTNATQIRVTAPIGPSNTYYRLHKP